jgi:PAS domain S-box-containing protein
MAHQAGSTSVQPALEQRIRELEDENGRLSRELENLSSAIARYKNSESELVDSERRQHEIARLLEIDQARLATVLRNLPVAVWVADQNGRLIANNDEADRIWAGETPLSNSTEEYQTYAAWDQKSGVRLQSDDYPIAVALRTGQPTEPMELKIRRFDGSEGTVLASAAPIKDRQGLVTGAVGVNVDITERRRLEDALSESEFRFRTMADETPVLIWVSDAAARTVFINKAYSDFFGVTLEEAQSGDWHILVHPEDQTLYINEFMACLKEQRSFRAQARVRRKDGQWRWVISNGKPRFSESGVFLGMAGSSLDITQQIRTAEALRASETKFRAAFENAAIGYALQTPNGEFVEANAAYCGLVGYSLDELRQLKFFELLHTEDYGKHMQLVQQLLTGAIPDFVIESRYCRKDGGIVWVRKSCSLLTETNGNPKWMLALIEDITERKQVEQALKVSEEHFQIALKNSPIFVYTTDRELRYTWVYDAPFGATAADIIGKTDEELGLGDSVSELVALKRSVLETGTGKRKEIQFRYQSAEYYYDLTVEPILDEKGEVTGLTVASVDITEKKRIEKSAHESEVKIEIQRRLMEQREQERLFIAQEIHDGPAQTLAGTIIELELIKASLNDPTLQSEFNRIGSKLKGAVGELRGLIAELRPPLLERLGLAQAIRAHVDDFSEKYPELELTHDISEEQGRLSKEASLGFFRICQEALSNIIRHANATKASVRFSVVEQMAILEIEDNGRGLEVIPDLTGATAEGHYGLSGMKERAEAVNGEFHLRSTKGKGTTVTVKIPTKRDEITPATV